MDLLSSASSSTDISNSSHDDDENTRVVKKQRLGEIEVHKDKNHKSSPFCEDKVPPFPQYQRGSVTIVPAEEAPSNHFQRTIPHKRGQWSGHIFLPVPALAEYEVTISNSVRQFRDLLERHGRNGTIVQHTTSQLHISLCKQFSLQLASVDSFVNKLAERLQMERATTFRLPIPVTVNPQGCRHVAGSILVNDEGTRSFWGWPVSPDKPHNNPNAFNIGHSALLRVVRHVDSVLALYNIPPYYDPPVFHISLASFPGDLRDLVGKENRYSDSNGTDVEQSSGLQWSSEHPTSLLIGMHEIVCNFGTTKSFSLRLTP